MRRWWVVGVVLMVGVVGFFVLGKDGFMAERKPVPLVYDDNNLGELTGAFFSLADLGECVRGLGNLTWQRSGGELGAARTVMFEYDKGGYRYNFLYADETDRFDPYHLTVRVHTVEGYRLVHTASLRGNRFGTGLGGPVIDDQWRSLLDPQVREDLDRFESGSYSQRSGWNKQVLEEYRGLLRCFVEERPALLEQLRNSSKNN